MDTVLFKETQHLYHEIWVVTGVMIIMAVTLFLLIRAKKYIFASLAGLLTIAIVYVLFGSRLETEIRQDGFYYRYPVFIWRQKRIDWNDVEKVYVRKYISAEFGGWGWKPSVTNDSAMSYTVWGDSGIQIIFKSKHQILFGTQKPREAQKALDKLGFTPANNQ